MSEKITFKYHPNLYNLDILEEGDGICQCCSKEVDLYYPTMYAVEDIDCLCLECIASGEAAKKFDGMFISDGDVVDDEAKKDELYKRTPGYVSWQGENWRACCDDFCAYLGNTNSVELQKFGVLESVLDEYNEYSNMELTAEDIEEDSYLDTYLFQCLHCKGYKINTDCD